MVTRRRNKPTATGAPESRAVSSYAADYVGDDELYSMPDLGNRWQGANGSDQSADATQVINPYAAAMRNRDDYRRRVAGAAPVNQQTQALPVIEQTNRRSSATPRSKKARAREASQRGYTTFTNGRADALDYRRDRKGNIKYDRRGNPKKKRNWALIILVFLLAIVLLGVVAVGGYIVYKNNITAQLNEGVTDELTAALSQEEVAPSDPFYVLILGVDRSEARENSWEFAGDSFRSDSMILARIDPRQRIVTLVSIERDTYVWIDGVGADKINASAFYGGSPLVVSTISTFAGVPIHHYVEIDFDGFEAAVDALGGIEVDVPITIDDDEAGGYVEAGLQTLNGEEALILCRSRHAYDQYNVSGDYYRMANQRLVLGAIAKKLLASDPVTMANTLSAMAGYITTDMSMDDIIAVALEMRGMNVDEDIYSAMNPTYSAYENEIWYEYSDNYEWKKMMARVDAGLPPYEDEARNENTGGTLDGTVTGWQEVY